MFILQCHKVQTNDNILLKRAETGIILIVFHCFVTYHVQVYTVTSSYCWLYMNQGPEQIY